jgi:hypothetical protein
LPGLPISARRAGENLVAGSLDWVKSRGDIQDVVSEGVKVLCLIEPSIHRGAPMIGELAY